MITVTRRTLNSTMYALLCNLTYVSVKVASYSLKTMLTTNAISFVLFVSVAVRCVTGQEAGQSLPSAGHHYYAFSTLQIS